MSKIINRNIKIKKNRHLIQPGKITYSDLNKPAKAFFSKKYKIAGKPDYVIQQGKKFIPVEFKTGNKNKPQKNHIFQLAAYCHLLEENYGNFVPYGILVYNKNYEFKIPFNPKIRFELETTINKMRSLLRKDEVLRNHDDINKCKNCSMRMYCNERLL